MNADKTEILNLNSKEKDMISFNYNGKSFAISTVEKIKICGLYFCTNHDEEYQLNVLEKIKKLTYKIKLWTQRHLTMEGKVLIVKTFGLSQIIYNMQSYGFNKQELASTERIIFQFLWSTKDNPKGIDRIKRSIMKNEYEKGGMRVTDVESLNRSLKLKQFIRAHNSNHVISKIQALVTTKSGTGNHLLQEYETITDEESICCSAQETLNIIIDFNRESYSNLPSEKIETDKNLIDEVSSINLTTYLRRKKKVFLLCMLKPLTATGIFTLGELTQAYEHEMDQKLNKTMRIILTAFPKTLRDIAKCFCEEINSDNQKVSYILIAPETRKEVNSITVKELQVTLKNALKKIEVLNFVEKLDINNFEEENITRFRNHCKNPKLRNIYFRLIHNDFFTHVRMKKYKMSESDECPRCGTAETTKHLLWECSHVKNIWSLFNGLMKEINCMQDCVNQYEDIFKACYKQGTNIVKARVIQELIQISRPVNWTKERIIAIVEELLNIEKFNAIKNRTIIKFDLKWNSYRNFI